MSAGTELKLHDAASRRTLQMYRTVNCEISSFPTCMSHIFSSFSDVCWAYSPFAFMLWVWVCMCMCVSVYVRLWECSQVIGLGSRAISWILRIAGSTNRPLYTPSLLEGAPPSYRPGWAKMTTMQPLTQSLSHSLSHSVTQSGSGINQAQDGPNNAAITGPDDKTLIGWRYTRLMQSGHCVKWK